MSEPTPYRDVRWKALRDWPAPESELLLVYVDGFVLASLQNGRWISHYDAQPLRALPSHWSYLPTPPAPPETQDV